MTWCALPCSVRSAVLYIVSYSPHTNHLFKPLPPGPPAHLSPSCSPSFHHHPFDQRRSGTQRVLSTLVYYSSGDRHAAHTTHDKQPREDLPVIQTDESGPALLCFPQAQTNITGPARRVLVTGQHREQCHIGMGVGNIPRDCLSEMPGIPFPGHAVLSINKLWRPCHSEILSIVQYMFPSPILARNMPICH